MNEMAFDKSETIFERLVFVTHFCSLCGLQQLRGCKPNDEDGLRTKYGGDNARAQARPGTEPRAKEHFHMIPSSTLLQAHPNPLTSSLPAPGGCTRGRLTFETEQYREYAKECRSREKRERSFSSWWMVQSPSSPMAKRSSAGAYRHFRH